MLGLFFEGITGRRAKGALIQPPLPRCGPRFFCAARRRILVRIEPVL